MTELLSTPALLAVVILMIISVATWRGEMKLDKCGIWFGNERFIALLYNPTCWEWLIEWRELHLCIGPIVVSLRRIE